MLVKDNFEELAALKPCDLFSLLIAQQVDLFLILHSVAILWMLFVNNSVVHIRKSIRRFCRKSRLLTSALRTA